MKDSKKLFDTRNAFAGREEYSVKNKQTRRAGRLIIAAFVMVAVLFTLPFAAAESGAAVRVNDRVFTAETVQAYINETAANMPLTVGTTADALFGDDKEAFLTAAAEHFVTVAIVEDKLAERGLDTFSPEEEEALQEYARQTYDLLWQSVADEIKEAYPDMDIPDRVITQTMESAGYSMDGIYEKAAQSVLMDRFAAEFCPEVTVTEEEVMAAYRETYVEPDRLLYENDIGLFEENVLFSGNTTTYVPEGYFYVKYIAFRPSQERSDAITRAQLDLTEAETETEAARSALAEAALDENADLTTARERCRLAAETEEAARQALDEAIRLTEEDFAPMRSLIVTSLGEGESFESLIAAHSVQPAYVSPEEPGYPFHPDSPNWEDNVRDEIAGLTKYGDCTGAVYTGGFVCVYCRMDDMACGEYTPDAETRSEMSETLLLAKQSAAMDEKVAAWRDEYDIEIDISGLVFPE